MVDAFSAHRLCALRFAGHVASRAELQRARDQLGLAAVVISEPPPPADGFDIAALPEWTEDGECANPSVPGEHCSFARWPGKQAPPISIAALRACDAEPVGMRDRPRTVVDVGSRCPAPGWGWSGTSPAERQELPCGVRLAGVGASPTDGASFALACRAPAPTPPLAPPGDHGEVAAFHCVVSTWALATFGQPAAGADAARP